MKETLRKLIAHIRGEVTTEELIRRGMKVGSGFKRLNQVMIDDSHCWLIEIGDDVTLAPRVHILAHDASTKSILGYTKIGRVTIGNNVFIGAGSVILPGVTIGNNVIIGANSTVTHDIPTGYVAVGCPARIICSIEEYTAKERKRMETAPIYGQEYTLGGNITKKHKQQQKDDLANGQIGYVE